MGTRDPRVDSYIAKSADFARPILTRIRDIVHEACPGVEESIKWGAPFFEYHGVLCGMAAFKAHCGLNLWKGALLQGDGAKQAAERLGRISSIDEFPPKKATIDCIKQLMTLNEEGVKVPTRPKPRAAEIVIPPELARALKKNKKAAAAFESFPPSHKREYADWIGGAKGEDTRKRRLEAALEWMAEGKSRNWKYERR